MPIRVTNPATGEELAALPEASEADVRRAIESAHEAATRPPGVATRRGWLQQIADRLLASKNDIGKIVTSENGKPLKEGVAEVEYAAGFFAYYAKVLETFRFEETLPDKVRGCAWTVHHRPAGVAAIITPWNFPLAMMAEKLSAALAAGCSVVVKPAENTPLSAVEQWKIFDQAGLDPGRADLVIGDAPMIGKIFTSHPAVRVVSFTGSTEVGRKLMAQAAPHIKRLALELGGNAPFIVCDDADLGAAADQLIANKFRAGGQTCVCANRILVHRSVHARFAEILAPKVRALVVGNGLDPKTDIGPLINRDGWDKVDRHVRDALSHGAKRLVGEDRPRPSHDWGCFYPPTLLSGITPEMVLCREETFGPVVALMPFDSDDEAIAHANASEFGLAAYLFTRRDASSLIARLQFGHVGLNTGTGPAPHAPFGGMKQSGFGREGGGEGIMEYLETQAVAAMG